MAAQPPALSVQTLHDRSLQIDWPASAAVFILEQTDALTPGNLWTPASAPELVNDHFSVIVHPAPRAIFYRLHLPLVTVASTSPLDGETGVAVTRETIVHFSRPLATNSTLTVTNFYAGFGGRRILSRIELSSDRTRASLFYLEPLPGSAHVNVVFDGTGLSDDIGQPLDADGDGVPGGVHLFGFDTLNLTPLINTGVIGTVYASELVPGGDTGTNAVNQPLAGVTIAVDGMEETLRAVTDANGNFTLNPAPPGRFFVHIDGRTVTNFAAGIHYPDQSYYPYVGKAWDATAGKSNNLAGGTGTIYLPLIKAGTLEPVSATQDTSISFPPAVVASNPALAGTSITVPANSLFNDNGTRGGKVGIAPVPPDRLPGPLPPGASVPIVITVQTDGALNFDQPAPVCFPNLPNPITGQIWPAGTKGSLISFNHKKGAWESIGDMTVSADGKLFCTDPGVGISQPGWHGCVSPKPFGPAPQYPPDCPSIYTARARVDSCVDACGIVFNWELEGLTSFLQASQDVCRSLPDEMNDACFKHFYVFANRRRAQFQVEQADCRAQCIACFGGPDGGPLKSSYRALAASDVAELSSLQEQIESLIAPYALNGSPIPSAVLNKIEDLQRQEDIVAGGSAAVYLKARAIVAEQQAATQLRASGLALDDLQPGNAPPYPVRYAATVLRASGLVVFRGETGPFGQYLIFAPPDGALLDVAFYDAKTKQYGAILPYLRPDAPYPLPRFTLSPLPSDSPDSDHDGLPDLVEQVLGTDPDVADTDGDGIPDGAEVEQGTNPLDGFVVQTGVIATTKTPSPALDIWTGNGVVATAEGAGGVSILGIYDGSNPTILAHVPTPFAVSRLAGVVGSIVAVGSPGLAIIDVTTPTTARVVRQVPLPNAQAITAGGSSAWGGSALGSILAVNLPSGAITSALTLPGGINDLAVAGDYLYALTDDHLYVISVANGGMRVVSSVLSPFVAAGNQRVFVGGGLAYTVHRKGYNTIDVSDPAKPVLLTAGATAQFGWKQIVANGSGLGVAAVGPNSTDDGPHFISLYDLSDPRTNNVFITTFETPGISRAVSIYNGLAYVAGDSAGVQVINYLPYDNKGKPPTISLTTTINLAGVTGVEEGKTATATATVTDDVQVRNVEFYLDGVKTFTDAAFPFEYRFITPSRTGSKTNFVIQARAVDTGGNATWSDPITIPLVTDATQPTVAFVSPTGGASVITLLARFSEPLAPSSITPNSLLVVSPGPDGTFGTADDAVVRGGAINYDPATSTAVLTFPSPLADGAYRGIITTNVADVAGNHLAANYSWQIHTGNGVYWTRQGDGFWDEPSNWSSGSVPGATDNVVVDVSPLFATVTVRTGDNFAGKLFANQPIHFVTGGVLQVANTFELDQDCLMDGGTIRGGTLIENGGSFRFTQDTRSTFDGVTVKGNLYLTNVNDRLGIKNGLDLDGTVFLNNSGAIGFVGSQTLSSGNVVFGDTGILSLEAGTTLTLASNIIVRGQSGSIGQGLFFGGPGKLVNEGLISIDVAGGAFQILPDMDNLGTIQTKNGASLTISSAHWSNSGTIDASGGANVTLAGSWNNTGTVQANGATLNLGSPSTTLTLAEIGTIKRTSSVLNFQGTLDLVGGTLNLEDASGSWVLNGGTIKNGSIVESGSGKLIIPSNRNNTFDAVTVTGDLDMTTVNAILVIKNGLTLHGAARLNDGATLGFRGAQTLDTGEIIFGSVPAYISLDVGAVLTLGQGAVVHGKNGYIFQGHLVGGAGQLINQGLISADVPGGEIDINQSGFTNTGTLQAKGAGAQLVIRSKPFNNTGQIEQLNGGVVQISP